MAHQVDDNRRSINTYLLFIKFYRKKTSKVQPTKSK